MTPCVNDVAAVVAAAGVVPGLDMPFAEGKRDDEGDADVTNVVVELDVVVVVDHSSLLFLDYHYYYDY